MATGGIDIINSYKILLMNCNGPDESTVPLRQKAFNEILETVEPSIIFTQECAPGIYPYSDQYIKIRGYSPADNTGFIFNQNQFKALMLNIFSYPDEFTKPLLFRVNKYFKGYYDRDCPQRIAEKLKERVSIALFESRSEPNFQILALSWHGPHHGFSDEDKRRLLVYMLYFVMNLHSSLGTPAGKHRTVLIGGDFNLDLTKWPAQFKEFFGQYYRHYTCSSEGAIRKKENQIDFFLLSTDFEVLNIRPYIMPRFRCTRWVHESTSPAQLRVDPPIEKWWTPKELFDHDPIEATINLPTYSSVPHTGLTDALSQLSLSQNTLPSALLTGTPLLPSAGPSNTVLMQPRRPVAYTPIRTYIR